MPSYSAEALVLKKTKLGETDSIITLLSADGRQLRAVAKGARKPGSALGARLAPGYVVELLLHTGKNLDIIREARLRDAHRAPEAGLERAAAAATVLELAEKSTRSQNPEPLVFRMANEALSCVSSARQTAVSLLAAAALLKISAALGYRPDLSEMRDLVPADQQWLERLLKARFVELQRLEGEQYKPVATGMLNFARQWLLTHLDIRLQSLDVLLRI